MKNHLKIFITGSSGFIGFHLSKLLLKKGFKIHGYDAMTNYYDLKLKEDRKSILLKNKNFDQTDGNLEDQSKLSESINNFKPNIIIHLAAQAGVRHSLEHPRSFIESNIIGTFNLLEVSKSLKLNHLLMASTSSIYGSNTKLPFHELDKADNPLSIYAATKKSTESLAHSYSHLWNMPITVFRFFTVYGPWGRPDMALFKFVSAILNDQPIEIYNKGEMYRDFTYIDDLVHYIYLLIKIAPDKSLKKNKIHKDSVSNVAPFRIVNIGNSEKVKLLDFINAIESILGKKAIRKYMPLQQGDLKFTLADTTLIKDLTNYSLNTKFYLGISNFIKWYLNYYKKKNTYSNVIDEKL